MQRKSIAILLSLSLYGLGACSSQSTSAPGLPPAASPTTANPSNQPEPMPILSLLPFNEPVNESPTPEKTAIPDISGAFSLPQNLAEIRFDASIDRFLDSKGESTRFKVVLLDDQGQMIDASVPIIWRSSRPHQFSVDAEGQITALVESGYSSITASIPGTDFAIDVVINIDTAGSSGGGGGGGGSPQSVNQAPKITELSASSTSVVGGNALVKLTGLASDDKTTLNDTNYSWTCTPQDNCGQLLSQSGSSVFWQSPNTQGNYTITLSVSDGSLSTSQDLSIEVQTGIGSIEVNPTS